MPSEAACPKEREAIIVSTESPTPTHPTTPAALAQASGPTVGAEAEEGATSGLVVFFASVPHVDGISST